jgi:hypothetical protein
MTREFTFDRPPLNPGLTPEVTADCERWWAKGRPFTPIRLLREPTGASCHGAQGVLECKNPPVAVQYITAFGDALHYCDPCAREQAARDTSLYDMSPRRVDDYEDPNPGMGITLKDALYGAREPENEE